MNAFAAIAVWGWAPVAVLLFAVLPARRAVLAAIIAGWLFLPMVEFQLSGLPNYGKSSATAMGALLGVLLFDAGRLTRFRPRLIDVAALGWTLAPIASSLSNGLGLYDGVASAIPAAQRWLIPYFLGRLYFSDFEGLRELAAGVFIGGMVYVPLCLYEVRMSPQLHTMFYGFHQHVFAQSIRFGGYRPTVFMQHGLAVGMWMTAASLSGVWLWRSGALRQVCGAPVSWMLPVLLGTTVLCKSVGALVLLAAGLGALEATKQLRTRALVVALAVAPLAYIGLRTTDIWTGASMVEAARAIAGDDRAASLNFRLKNEDVLIQRALQQPVFGWGGWGRNRPEGAGDTIVTDGMWVIALGQNGVVGLTLMLAVVLWPALRFASRVRAGLWYHPGVGGAAAMAVLLALFTTDCLFNAISNPVFVLAAGGVSGLRLAAARPAGSERPAGVGRASWRQHGYSAIRP